MVVCLHICPRAICRPPLARPPAPPSVASGPLPDSHRKLQRHGDRRDGSSPRRRSPRPRRSIDGLRWRCGACGPWACWSWPRSMWSSRMRPSALRGTSPGSQGHKDIPPKRRTQKKPWLASFQGERLLRGVVIRFFTWIFESFSMF